MLQIKSSQNRFVRFIRVPLHFTGFRFQEFLFPRACRIQHICNIKKHRNMNKKLTFWLTAFVITQTLLAQNGPHRHGPMPLTGENAEQVSSSRATVFGLVAQRRDDYNATTNTWAPNDSSTFTLNANANRTKEVELDYNTSNQLWKEKFQQDRYLNSFGQKDSTIEKYWVNHLNAFRNSTKNTNTYNGNQHMTNYLLTVWDTATNAWVNNVKITYQPNLGGKSTYTLSQNWNTGSNTWVNNRATAYVYGSGPDYRILADTAYEWNTTTNQWDNDFREEYLYNALGNDSLFTFYLWNSGSAAFAPLSQTSYTYNANNYVIEELDKTWDNGSNTWVNGYRNTFIRDANGNAVNTIRQQWVSGAWQNSSQVLTSYDADGNQTIYQANSYNVNTSVFVPMFRFTYYYEAFEISGLDNNSEIRNALVYPNPFTGSSLSVTTDLILPYAVYDMQGSIVTQGELQPGTNSIILNEPKGNYILKAGNATTKIVKL